MSLLYKMKHHNDIDEKSLETELKKASQKYYTDGSSNLSDAEFDAKLKMLKSINPDNDVVTSVGHGYQIEKDSTYGRKREHPYCIVGSLDKVREWDALSSLLAHKHVVCSLKLDGISCALYYTDGNLDYALTRGNGHTGIDITDKIKIIAPDMMSVSFNNENFTGAIRGELLMSFSNFKKLESVHPNCRNPRNSVAGLINQKDADESELKLIYLVIYSIMAADDLDKYGISDQCSVFKKLNSIHKTAPWCDCTELHEASFQSYMRDCKDMFDNACDYPSDGIVIASNSIEYDKQGLTLDWASQAFKFPSEQAIVTVTDVEWNLSKTGYMIPKVKFSPVILAGTSVEYATGFNARYIKDNNIQSLCQITVTKSGEIIPYIVKVNTGISTKAVLPEVCPACGEELQWDGVNICCMNPLCSGKSLWDLVIWIKSLAQVDGLSDSLITKFCNILGIKTVEDLYHITPDYVRNALISYGQTGKQARLFLRAFTTCREGMFSIYDAMKACNIPRFGDKTCKLCLDCKDALIHCATVEFISPRYERYFREHLGDANCDSLIVNDRKLKRLSFIRENIVDDNVEHIESKGDICITGKLSVKRKDFEKEVEKAGYSVVSKVKKDTKFLITDDKDSGSSKNKDADKYGVQKITEHEFRKTYM